VMSSFNSAKSLGDMLSAPGALLISRDWSRDSFGQDFSSMSISRSLPSSLPWNKGSIDMILQHV